MIRYKGELEGLEVETREESYTSKCSWIDDESIEKHEEYVGKRVKRGLFRSMNGIKINADLNGAANILRKSNSQFNCFEEGIEVVSVQPLRIHILKKLCDKVNED